MILKVTLLPVGLRNPQLSREECCRYAVAPVPGGGADAWMSYYCLERVTAG